jgi:enoyl-CoA hydratase
MLSSRQHLINAVLQPEESTEMTVDLHIDQGVATVTLNEPDRRNALHPGMIEEIVGIFERIEAPDSGVGAVVVTGAGPGFCAGAALGNLGGDELEPREDRERGLRLIYEGFLRVGRSPLLTIAAVNGSAVGAGMNLALCCDMRIAARKAKFITRFVELGLHPGGGHTWMLRRAVGFEAAAAMLLAGEVLDGEEAARRGLAWKCVADDELLATAQALGAKAAEGPAELVRLVKSTLQGAATIDEHGAAVDFEIERQLWSQEQPFFKERLAAMQNKISKRSSG